ncbi:MAG: DUF2207 family protein [bacterium]
MRWSRWLLLVLLAAGFITAASGNHALGKNYTFPLVEIAAQVNPDGSLWITERRTYEFSGAVSWTTYTLERRGWTNVTDVTVADDQRPYRRAQSGEPGTFQVSLTPAKMDVKWHFRSQDERKTFTIRYRVLGVVTRYRDTAELYWRFVGTEREAPTARLDIRALILGASKDALRAWGHGPPNGLVTLLEDEVRLRVDDLPAGKFVEGRILFPGRLVPRARVANENALPRILAEEARRARKANLERLMPWLNLAMFPAAIIGALLIWSILYLRTGREHRMALDAPYLRAPPAAYPPAILGALLRWGRPSTIDFAATVLDLARRGHLTIHRETPSRPVYRFIRAVTSITNLPQSEQQALELLFRWASGYQGITDAEFGSAVRHQSIAALLFREWQRAVETEARAFDFFDEESRRLQESLARVPRFALLGGVALTAIALLWLRIPLFAGVVALPLGGLVLSGLRGSIGRRTVEGAKHLALWRAFRSFLCDFSTLQDATPPAIAVWEVYLPYAVTLGVADRVIKQLPAAYPDAADSYAPSWYVSSGGLRSATGLGEGFAGLVPVVRSLSRSLFFAGWRSSSSASGRGGGFSRDSGTSSGSRGGGGTGGQAG